MGMDYKYAGSASYPRFDREVCELVKLFGGKESKQLKERRDNEIEGSISYWFGFMSGDNTIKERFVFPSGTPAVLVKWFNNLYDPLSVEETREVWSFLKEKEEAEKISLQICHELKTLVELDEGWEIG